MTYPFHDPALPLKERVRDLISRLTIEEKTGFIPTRNQAVERLGIPAYSIGAEGAHGFVDREGHNTTFPQTIGLAAGWDRDVLRKVGEIAATEARCCYKAKGRKGGLSVWSPTIDLERDPRWGRTEEGYGEDPFLTSELSCAYIRGAQGDDPFYLRISCGPKHFFANNNEKNRGSCNCSIPPRLLNEYYLVPFKAATEKAKAVSMMTAYNEVNGIPMMLHPILRDTVKKEWGLDGHIVTDGGDFLQTVKLHHYFETHGETLAAALKNGADSMTDLPEEIIAAVKDALERKLIDEAELDEHLERILSIRFRLGQFDPEGRCPYDVIDETYLMRDEYRKASLEAVKKSVVLLKNDAAGDKPLLPLRPDTLKGTIAVMGPLADELHLDWYTGFPTYTSTPLDGLKEIYGDKIIYTDCRDIVSFTTEDNRPMVLIDTGNAAGKTFAPGKSSEKPARFYMEDWGWGVRTFTDIESGLMLQGSYARREAGVPFDDSEITIYASAKNNLQWFGFTLFNVVPQEGGTVLLKTHDNRRIAALETGKQVKQHDDPLPGAGELFRMKIERDGLSAAAEAAAKAEQVIFFAGNDPMINGREEIDRPSMNLPPRHEELIRKIAAVNPRTVLVLISGYPYTIKETAKQVPAILWMAHGIQETGHGIADVLCGNYSPAGRLPLTWYEDEKQLPDIMEYDIMKGGATYQYFPGSVLWPFGHGLSYSAFAYSELKIDKTAAGKNDTVNVSFTVKNTGRIVAEEVSQMYVTVSGSVFRRPVKTLKGFTRISLAPGEQQTINFSMPIQEIAVWDSFSGGFRIEAGYCTVLVGASSADIRLSGGFNVMGENLLPRKPAGSIYAERFDDYSGCFLHEKRGEAIPAVFNKENGGWVRFSALDFGEGCSHFSAIVQGSHNCRIEIRLDAPDGALAGTLDIPNTGDISFYPLPRDSYRRLPVWAFVENHTEKICGIHDLYLVMYGKTGLWRFEIKNG
ncbi:MAG: glycoside hydrolase family 3 C-terminal domain-containing protein [Treponema sp.]|jgi:beta-glucosidase|nr:glycoside hydrolase family 3 C-terminal domain-containing protein [Treponema sp.]